MAKRVFATVVVLAVAVWAYVGYTSYDSKRAGGTGDVFSNDPPAAKTRMDSESRTSGGIRMASEVKAAESDGAPARAAAATTPGSANSAAQSGPAAVSAAQATQTGQPAGHGMAAPPEGDTIARNPPNGMVFSEKGRYQLYGQGNITWRLDSETGKTCIAFATEDEWKKAKVYRAGCGGE